MLPDRSGMLLPGLNVVLPVFLDAPVVACLGFRIDYEQYALVGYSVFRGQRTQGTAAGKVPVKYLGFLAGCELHKMNGQEDATGRAIVRDPFRVA